MAVERRPERADRGVRAANGGIDYFRSLSSPVTTFSFGSLTELPGRAHECNHLVAASKHLRTTSRPAPLEAPKATTRLGLLDAEELSAVDIAR